MIKYINKAINYLNFVLFSIYKIKIEENHHFLRIIIVRNSIMNENSIAIKSIQEKK